MITLIVLQSLFKIACYFFFQLLSTSFQYFSHVSYQKGTSLVVRRNPVLSTVGCSIQEHPLVYILNLSSEMPRAEPFGDLETLAVWNMILELGSWIHLEFLLITHFPRFNIKHFLTPVLNSNKNLQKLEYCLLCTFWKHVGNDLQHFDGKPFRMASPFQASSTGAKVRLYAWLLRKTMRKPNAKV